MSTVVNKTPEKLILERLQENGQKMSWLALKVGLSTGHLHSVLKGKNKKNKRNLTDEIRNNINIVLGTDF